MKPSRKALIVIDVQNDYFRDGLFPLWNAEKVLDNTVEAIRTATARSWPILLVQHLADTSSGPAPFFNPNTPGAALHQRILDSAGPAPVIIKRHADSFLNTSLDQTLRSLHVNELLLCGMMTQHCVTHTALSPTASGYTVSILPDCCTTVSALLHHIALKALSDRLPVVPIQEIS